MQKQIDMLVNGLKSFGLPVFEDEIAEDEEAEFVNNEYHCFVFETLGMTKMDDLKSINQVIAIYYYSENRDDLDERTIDIINALKDIPKVTFDSSTKQRLQKKDTDQFVDRVVLAYNRQITTKCGVL